MGLVLFSVLLDPFEEAEIDENQEKEGEVWLYSVEAEYLHGASRHNTHYVSDLPPKHIPCNELLRNTLEVAQYRTLPIDHTESLYYHPYLCQLHAESDPRHHVGR